MSKMGRYVLQLQEAEEATYDYTDRQAYPDAETHKDSKPPVNGDGDRRLLQGSNRCEQHGGSTGAETADISLATDLDIPF